MRPARPTTPARGRHKTVTAILVGILGIVRMIKLARTVAHGPAHLENKLYLYGTLPRLAVSHYWTADMTIDNEKIPALPARGRSWRGPAAVLGVIVAGVSVSLISFFWVREQSQRELRETFDRLSKERVTAIQDSADDMGFLLQAIRAFYVSTKEVRRDEFRTFVAPFQAYFTSIVALQWVARVPGDQRAAFEAAARKDGLKDFQIHDRGPGENFVPAPAQTEYYPIYYREPAEGDQEAIKGLDMTSQPARWPAFRQAGDSGNMVAAQTPILSMPHRGQRGLLIAQPIYEKGRPTKTLAQRRENLRGFVVAILYMKELFEHGLASLQPAGIDVRILDPSAPKDKSLIYVHASRTRPDPSSLAAGPAEPEVYRRI